MKAVIEHGAKQIENERIEPISWRAHQLDTVEESPLHAPCQVVFNPCFFSSNFFCDVERNKV